MANKSNANNLENLIGSCRGQASAVTKKFNSLVALMKNPNADKSKIRSEYDKLKEQMEKYTEAVQELMEVIPSNEHGENRTIGNFDTRAESMIQLTNQVRERLSGTEHALPDVTQGEEAPTPASSVSRGQESNPTSGDRAANSELTVTTGREADANEQVANLELQQLNERQEVEQEIANSTQKLAQIKLNQAKQMTELKRSLAAPKQMKEQ